jgi:hypothetical protein
MTKHKYVGFDVHQATTSFAVLDSVFIMQRVLCYSLAESETLAKAASCEANCRKSIISLLP